MKDLYRISQPNGPLTHLSFYELSETLQWLGLGTLIGWRRRRRPADAVRGASEQLLSSSAGKRSSDGTPSCSVSTNDQSEADEWASVVLNPRDKAGKLPWLAEEQLIVIQEASYMEKARVSWMLKRKTLLGPSLALPAATSKRTGGLSNVIHLCSATCTGPGVTPESQRVVAQSQRVAAQSQHVAAQSQRVAAQSQRVVAQPQDLSAQDLSA